MIADWERDVRPGTEAVTDVTGIRQRRFVDYGPVHLVTTGALARLTAQPGAAEPDTRLLSVLARHHREPVPGLGRAAGFGCYANVETPGRIEAGAGVRVLTSKG
jgi:hypothetical protein